MGRRPSIKKAVHAAIISAFAITTALIWRDVVIEAVELMVGPQDALIWKFIIAVIATIILVIALSIILKTEEDVDFVMKKLKDGKVKFTKAPTQTQEKKSN